MLLPALVLCFRRFKQVNFPAHLILHSSLLSVSLTLDPGKFPRLACILSRFRPLSFACLCIRASLLPLVQVTFCFLSPLCLRCRRLFQVIFNAHLSARTVTKSFWLVWFGFWIVIYYSVHRCFDISFHFTILIVSNSSCLILLDCLCTFLICIYIASVRHHLPLRPFSFGVPSAWSDGAIVSTSYYDNRKILIISLLPSTKCSCNCF